MPLGAGGRGHQRCEDGGVQVTANLCDSDIPSGWEIVDSNIKVKLVEEVGAGAVRQVVVSIEVGDVWGEGVSSTSYVVTQWMLGDRATRGRGEGQGVRGVTRS